MPAEAREPQHWLDDDAGPVVRPYALTQGRVAPAGSDFDLLAFVVATMPDVPPDLHPQPEHDAIVAECWEPVPVADLAATLKLSLGVLRVLLGDLRSAGIISLYEPPAASQPHDIDVLEAVVNGLRAL